MKIIVISIVLSLFCVTTFSQIADLEKDLKKQSTDTVEGWKRGGIVNLGFSQVSLTNWAAGGLNSTSGNGLISLFANYKKGSSLWQNSLDLGYGLLNQGIKNNKKVLKTDDKIDLSSKFGKKAYKNLYYAALLNIKTQMTSGYNYPNDSVMISNFLAPAYIMSAIGMDYAKKDFTAFLAPFTAKTTIVNDDSLSNAGAFGVEAAEYDEINGNLLSLGHKIRNEFGGYIRMKYRRVVMKNVTLVAKADVFSNYINNPQNIDVSLELLISMKVNKYITTTLGSHILYDHDIDIAWTDKDDNAHFGPNTQLKEMLNVGFSYKL